MNYAKTTILASIAANTLAKRTEIDTADCSEVITWFNDCIGVINTTVTDEIGG